MKKVIPILLVVIVMALAVFVISQYAPQSFVDESSSIVSTEAVTEETESATNTPPASVEDTTAPPIDTEAMPILPDQVFDEQYWLAKCSENEVVSLSITDPHQCESVLHSLGFYEFHTGVRESKTDENTPLYPKELTIAGDSFKLVFDYNLPSATSDNYYYMQNYILYGTKATGAEQIVHIPTENLIEEWINDWNELVPQEDSFCHLIYYSADTNVEGASWVTNTIRYYEDSQNLYNIVKTSTAQYPDKDGTPRILAEKRTLHESHLESNKKTETEMINGIEVEIGEFTIDLNGSKQTYRYRDGMTLQEWATSNFNTSGWRMGDDNCLHYQNYLIENPHYDIKWLFAYETTIVPIKNTSN